MTKEVVRKRPAGVAAKMARYIALGREAAALKSQQSTERDALLAFVEQEGNHEIDEEKGHLLHTLPDPVTIGTAEYTGFMKQRKVGQVFLEDTAQALCESKGFALDDYTSRVVDQDKVVRLYAEDKISEQEFSSLTEETVTWAIAMVKA